MANLTEEGHHKTWEALFCEPNVHVLHHNIFLASFNIFLSVTASLGNVLILIALQKESSLHPPSKLMFRCLAITDLCVGLISQPMFAAGLLSQRNELRNFCSYFTMLGRMVKIVFSGVSLLTATTISVDRLLALSLGLRYRQVVTVRRVGAILSCFWLVCVSLTLIDRFWNSTIVEMMLAVITILCLMTSAYCYTKILLRLRHHQVQIEAGHAQQGQPNGGGIPLNIARYRKTVSVALWIQMTLVACYLPQALFLSLSSVFFPSQVSLIISLRYTATLMLLNSSLNPFMYCWKIKEMRQAVKDTLTQCCLSN